ncbi:hypothetical protein [Hymenobacter edaphi]|uniref:Uncharacterized protein n=1 Tax=Hymenobacter edaphi TaxID=2211146 RepID=A0A328BEQ6_9BACT|nr:hypothetical protein [Hymenobacter edaphi]RAK65219.1 hypothetical protein DLM85_16925 [Hymenobacter edaphi]
MNDESSFRQNPDEFHGLGAEDNAENLRRGQQAAQQHPEAGQTGQPSAGHTNAPNYGEFGHPEGAAPTAQPEGFQPRYGQEMPPQVDDTHHGDDRFRHSGTRNWATDEPANPHQAKPGEWSDTDA